MSSSVISEYKCSPVLGGPKSLAAKHVSSVPWQQRRLTAYRAVLTGA